MVEETKPRRHHFSTDSYSCVVDGIVTAKGRKDDMHRMRKRAAKEGKRAFVGMTGGAIGHVWDSAAVTKETK